MSTHSPYVCSCLVLAGLAYRAEKLVDRGPLGEVYSCVVGIRTVAKLGEIKLKQIQQLNTADSSFLVRKHKEVLNLMMLMLQLDTYGLTWAQFFKGVGVGALLVWLLMR
ncbi:hypothetical protein OAL66_02160 [bacterium]|nr:hypothetical protein [bacterium]